MKMITILFIIIISVALLFLIWFIVSNYYQKGEIEWNDENTAIISINGKEIEAQVSASSYKKAQGLSGVVFMEEDKGMLFIFGTSQAVGFSMREMKFPLDFVWINNNKVVRVDKNVDYPKNGEDPITILPQQLIDMVLEINAGTIDKLSIQKEDDVSIQKIK
ncbi:MAG: DUF192 domain-containing protein [Candidatus Paceibacterota bacterium]|jgi:hypothetical protein